MRNGFLLAIFAVAAFIRSGYASHEVSEENLPGQETSSNQPSSGLCLEENSTSSNPFSDENDLNLERFSMESDSSDLEFPYSQIKHSSEFFERGNPEPSDLKPHSTMSLQGVAPLKIVPYGKEPSSDAGGGLVDFEEAKKWDYLDSVE